MKRLLLVALRLALLLRMDAQAIRPVRQCTVVARAIELFTTCYCPVIDMLGKVAEAATRYEIE